MEYIRELKERILFLEAHVKVLEKDNLMLETTVEELEERIDLIEKDGYV